MTTYDDIFNIETKRKKEWEMLKRIIFGVVFMALLLVNIPIAEAANSEEGYLYSLGLDVLEAEFCQL